MKIIFIRHGETDQNVDYKAGKPIKEKNYPLNNLGKSQVEETAKKLKDEKIDLIITSPYLRAKMTADIINKYHNIPMEIENDIREINVGFIGKEAFHEHFDMDKNLKPGVENGETVKDFFTRVYNVINKIKEKYPDKTICIVAHGGVSHAFRAYFNELEWKGNLRVDRMKNADIRIYNS